MKIRAALSILYVSFKCFFDFLYSKFSNEDVVEYRDICVPNRVHMFLNRTKNGNNNNVLSERAEKEAKTEVFLFTVFVRLFAC